MDENLEQALNKRLDAIHDRIKWIANAEEKAAWVNGIAAQGVHDPERERLLNETDRILDELTRLGGSPKFIPK